MAGQFNNFDNDLELKLEPISNDNSNNFGSSETLKGKRLIIILAALILLGLVGFGIVKLISSTMDSPTNATAVDKPSAPALNYTSAAVVLFPEIVTNLAPTNDKDSYIKLSMGLELNNSKDQAEIDKKLNLLKDAVIVFLRELRASDLTSSGGSMMLKTEIIKRINKIMYPIEIKDVLFREIFVNN